ncbi:MAG: hypothetical protein HC904_16200 [Blastochloris sp.]|nr:hypothetical protein [Blastochloris sp.]
MTNNSLDNAIATYRAGEHVKAFEMFSLLADSKRFSPVLGGIIALSR